MAINETKKNDETLLIATFNLGEGLFGIDTALIQEVVRVGDMTPVHHAPAYVMGIRNLRGRIVTVIDLQVRIELGSAELTPASRILIVDNQGEPVGLLVDSIADTVTVNAADIQPTPPGLHGIQGRNLIGVYRSGERLVALLDVGVVLQTGERREEGVLKVERSAP